MGSRSGTYPAPKIADKAVRQQLSRILASKTFSQVERLKRFISFIVSETSPAAAASSRSMSSASRSSARSPPSTRAPIRSSACRRAGCARGSTRYYREEGQATRSIDRTAQGRLRAGLPAAGKRRAGKRSLTRDAGRPQHRRGAALRRSQPGGRPRLLLPRRARRDRPRADVDRDAARARGAAGDEARAQDRTDAALVIAGSVRDRRGDALRVTTQLVDGAQRLLPVVGIVRRAHGRRRRRRRKPCRGRSSTRLQPESSRRTAPGDRRSTTTWPRATSTCRAATT